MKLKFAVGGLLALVVSSLSVWAAEDGSAGNPYLIGSEVDLAKITQYGMGEAGKGKCFELTADFALTKPWTGIGTYNSATDCFSGILDGKSHRISNVVISDEGSGANKYRGFFNQIDGGTVKNLTVATSGFGATLPSGEYGCAAIAGAAYNATIENCVAEGAISGTHNVAGIVIRIKDTSIIGCTNKATITGSYTKVAGICALNQDSTTACLIDGCVNEGAVMAANGTDAGRDGVAGIIAYVCDATLTIRDCANKGVVAKGTGASSSARVGQIVAYNYSGVSALEGTITGTADVRMVGDVYGNAIDRHLATVSGNIATFVADADVVAGKGYKAMATGGAVSLAKVGDRVTIDTSLATVKVTTTAADAELVQEGDYYALVKVTDITDVVRLAGKGETVLTSGTQAVAGKYSVANAFGKTISKDSRVLLKEQANDIVWTIAEDFCPGEEFIVSSYTLRRLYYAEADKSWDNTLSRQRAPSSFALEGTVDGKTWTMIDERTVEWNDANEMEKSFTVAEANLDSYRIYRFRIRATNSDNADAKCGFQYIALKGTVGVSSVLDDAVLGGNFATIVDDLVPAFDAKLEFDFSFDSLDGTQGFFSNGHNNEAKKFRLFFVDSQWQFDYGGNTFKNATKPALNTRYKLVVDGPVVTLNGVELFNAGEKLTDPGTRGLSLFSAFAEPQYPDKINYPAKVTVHGVKVWDGTGRLQLELRPGIALDGSRALLADAYGVRSYASRVFSNSEHVRNELAVHPSEVNLVAKMRAVGKVPSVTPGANVTLAAGQYENLFTTGFTNNDRLLLKEEATTLDFEIPADYEPGKPFVLTRFTVLPCVDKWEDSLNTAAERAPAQFEFQASADGATWKTLYAQVEKLTRADYQQGDKLGAGTDADLKSYRGLSFEIPETNRGDYRKYRLITTATNRGATDTGSRWGVQELKLYGTVGIEPRYDPVEYVQNNAANYTYYKTGLQPSTADWTIEIKGSFTTDNTTCGLFCSRGSSSTRPWVLWRLNTGVLSLWCDSAHTDTTFKPVVGQLYTFKVVGNKLYVDNNPVCTSGTTAFAPGGEVFLMASHNGGVGVGNQANFRLASCKITDANGAVLRDYVAVKRTSDNVGGLFDRYNSVFLPSSDKSPVIGSAAADVDFRQRGRAVALATELVDGTLPHGPLTFAFEGNQILQGTLYAAFDDRFVGTDMDDWADVVELGTLKNGVATMTVDKLKVPNHRPCVKFFVCDDLGGVSYTRSYGTGLRGMVLIIR